ncbi:hypothetical protein ACFFV7_27975 [Nonomuraea spiralis]|uniref:Uncharacterized protein n=1 Tax=Nonomuraea spiralis TaxID=46182 RepID=A0ABV5IKL2_9ACTN|nr:hypothetical protein [Nonomuraea spiralis]GGT37057.1 hypothetical protein GCM10010176_096450 [Nonomuraea spiralis]
MEISVARIRSVPLALALFAAPWGFVVANGAYAWATRAGGGDDIGAEALALASAPRPLLLGLALLRSHVVPLGAAAAVLAWPPLHVIGLVAGSEWFEVAGAVLQAAGLAIVGIRLLNAPR